MIRYFTLVCLSLILINIATAFSQSVGINIDGTQPNSSAMLDVKSNSKGLLPPRMTQAERNAISNPEEGLLIYNTTTHKPNFWNGSVWMNYDGTSAMVVGDMFGGGKIGYFFQPSDHGYVSGEIHGIIFYPGFDSYNTWGCESIFIPTANQTATGYAKENTNAILASCFEDCAAWQCSFLLYGDHDDWLLPTYGDYQALYQNNSILNIFQDYMYYWTSSNTTGNYALATYLFSGAINNQAMSKGNIFKFFVIRYF